MDCSRCELLWAGTETSWHMGSFLVDIFLIFLNLNLVWHQFSVFGPYPIQIFLLPHSLLQNFLSFFTSLRVIFLINLLLFIGFFFILVLLLASLPDLLWPSLWSSSESTVSLSSFLTFIFFLSPNIFWVSPKCGWRKRIRSEGHRENATIYRRKYRVLVVNNREERG